MGQMRNLQPLRKLRIASDVGHRTDKKSTGHQGNRRQRIHTIGEIDGIRPAHDDQQHEWDEQKFR